MPPSSTMCGSPGMATKSTPLNGQSITGFMPSREMVAAMREAIKGYRTTCDRDASLGNIVNADDAPEGSHTGPLQGWIQSGMDHVDRVSDGNAKSLKEDGEELSPNNIDGLKERRGAYYFLAIELLEAYPGTVHEAFHDIESFYWVLVWVVLRHTRCHREGVADSDALCQDLFSANKDSIAANQKGGWIWSRRPFVVSNNEPLTTLIRRFNIMLVLNQIDVVDLTRRALLTHGAVLAAFDEALAMEGWPENDCKARTLLEKPRTTVPPSPIVADVAPGYPIHSEGRALRSKIASKTAPTAGLPTVPSRSDSASGSHASAQCSGTKRAHEDDESALSGATHSGKRSKVSTMAPPLAPRPGPGDAVAGPSGATTSRGRGKRSGGSKAASLLGRQPSRRSSRIQAQKEKKALGRGSAR
ncbi:hypothetical protein PYCCODRAFT_1481008 [Trametes coccinea BRFM310]|uniref:Fungal-type protein kinase domain-containing protein n=1 Tax=Trametes coccinea (strain BRFM310) TaxID=1353009 RepID=A0A1Y2I9L7_TRAC3|nr:hypothetical protein PYCCODRAFT_1481008 [Trametes coccinea BRFM310]